jgi:hypothetical protein
MDHDWQAPNKNELIIEVWEHLDCESVGATELAQIQAAVHSRFGIGAVDSPARIARLLADEGAELRHPEILDFDSQWRLESAHPFASELNFSTVLDATASMRKLEEARKNAHQNGNETVLAQIRQFVRELKDELTLEAHNKAATEIRRCEAKEIVQWLSLWQRTPELFTDWLDLRLDSPEFRRNFPNFSEI